MKMVLWVLGGLLACSCVSAVAEANMRKVISEPDSRYKPALRHTMRAPLKIYEGGAERYLGDIIIESELNVIPYFQQISIEPNTDILNFEFTWDIDPDTDADGDGITMNDSDATGRLLWTYNYSNEANSIILIILDRNINRQFAFRVDIPTIFFNSNSRTIVDLERIARFEELEPARKHDLELIQEHMEPTSLEYMTEYEARITRLNVGFNLYFPSPGRYVFTLSKSTGEQITQIAVWAYKPTQTSQELGLILTDIGFITDTGFIPFYDYQDAKEKIEWLHSHYIKNIIVYNQIWIESVDPLRIVKTDHTLSDEELIFVYSLLREGAAAMPLTNSLQRIFLEAGVAYVSDINNLNREWIDEYFRQLRGYVLRYGELFETIGVKRYLLESGPMFAFRVMNPQTKAYIERKWRDLIAAVREVYAGEIGLSDFVYMSNTFSPNKDYNLLREVDFLSVAIYPLYCHDVNCNAPEIQNTVENLLWQIARYKIYFPNIKYIIVRLNAFSFTDAILGNLPPETEGRFSMDEIDVNFQVQVRILEGVLNAFARCPKIDGLWINREYWKLLNFKDFHPENWMDAQIIGDGSLQGKPAFEVFYLWNLMINHPKVIEHPTPSIEQIEIPPKELVAQSCAN